jgi:hypothetical protein
MIRLLIEACSIAGCMVFVEPGFDTRADCWAAEPALMTEALIIYTHTYYQPPSNVRRMCEVEKVDI